MGTLVPCFENSSIMACACFVLFKFCSLVYPFAASVYYDKDKDRLFEFLTNIMEMTAEQIGLLYKMRWQIEMLFKQLKQNFPLKYFLADNENAIKIQTWCTLIANLLFTIIQKNIKKKISFSNLVSFARQHLFSYHKINDLIEKTEKDWHKKYTDRTGTIKGLFDG